MTQDRRAEDRPNEWLFHTLSRIEEQQTRHGAEMRLGIQEIKNQMAAHQLEDALVAQQVIEMRAKMEKHSDARRHLQTLLLSTGLLAVWEGVKHVLGWAK